MYSLQSMISDDAKLSDISKLNRFSDLDTGIITMNSSSNPERSDSHGGALPPGVLASFSQVSHVVQFYEDDEFLTAAVADFLADGLTVGQPAVVLATQPHCVAFLRHLTAKGFDVDGLQADGRLTCLDARETLARFMVGTMPDVNLFQTTLGRLIEDSSRGRPYTSIRAYGEMVDVLWKDGNASGAIRVEELWNDLAGQHSFSLLCAYAMGNFYMEAHTAAFEEICRQHHHVILPKPNDGTAVEGGTLDVLRLHQQAQALENEIRHRQELENALREALAQRRRAEEDLRDFVESAVEGLHRASPDGTILWANQAELDLLGYAREAYVAHHIAEFYADRDVVDNILERLARNEIIRNCEVRLRCKDGSIRQALIHANALWEDGEFIHTRCFTRDVTDRTIAEEASHRLAAVIQSSDDAIISKDLHGTVASWNPAAERMFGYPAEEVIGRSIRLIIPADRQAEEDEVLARLCRGEMIDHFETVRRRKDGSEIHVSLTVSPVKDGHNRIIGASKIARDITDRIRADAERERLLAFEQSARREAEEANRVKDEFLAMLSHELRTPLNAILGWTQIAKADGRVKKATKVTTHRVFDVIERNATSQLRLINDLLDVSRIVSGKLQLTWESVDLIALAIAVVDSVRPTAEAKAIDLRIDFDDAAPYVRGDPARLQQVVMNLLSNAIKFTPSGGRIDLGVECTDSEARITIRDTGQGIPPEFLPFVFDRFRQADATMSRKYGGLGLGLAIVRYLVDAHGGTVSAASAGAGLGATFTVTLPLSVSEVGRADRRAGPGAPRSMAGVQVLVVDDDLDAREMLRCILEQDGAEVTTLTSTDSVVDVLLTRHIDVLLGDLGMPGQDGYALLESIRSHVVPHIRKVTAIAVTAYAGDEHRARALAAGYDGYVTKPVDADRLVHIIQRLLPHEGGTQLKRRRRRA
jgi:PAS domain S-box-containing protein